MHTYINPDDDTIRQLLDTIRNIAVLGLSPKPNRPSHSVSSAMQGFGYRIIPVRPGVSEILGEKAYARLEDLPETPGLVNVFRASKYVPRIIDTCIDLRIPAVWLQEGVSHDASAIKANDAGITVVMDRCIYKEYRRLL